MGHVCFLGFFFSFIDHYNVLPSTPVGIFQDRLLGGRLVGPQAMHISKLSRYCQTDFQNGATMSTFPISVRAKERFSEDGQTSVY